MHDALDCFASLAMTNGEETNSTSAGPPTRQLGLVAAIALVMGNMIGSGVFLLPASLAPFGWNAVGGWIVTISGALVLAYVLARLTRALPDADGAIGFVRRAFGHVPAFLISWVYLVSVWTAVVTIADGKLVRVEFHLDQGEALAGAGLSA